MTFPLPAVAPRAQSVAAPGAPAASPTTSATAEPVATTAITATGTATGTAVATAETPPDLHGDPTRPLRPADLPAELARLETRRFTDRAGIRSRAERVLALAREHGMPHETARARLVLADESGRGNDVAGASQTAWAVLTSARAHGDAVVEARAEAVLAWCLFRMGAMGDALLHAVEAARLLPPTAPAHFPVDHRMVLALLSGIQSTDDSYVGDFDSVLATADRLGEPHLLLAVLNNYAWTHWTRGRAADAVALVARIEAVSLAAAIPLNSTVLDTMASVLLDTGDLDRAEEIARSMLSPGIAEAEARALPDALLTLATLCRRRGDPAEALDLVLRAVAAAAERGLPELTATATEAQSRLLAENGDYRGAYEALVVSHATSIRVRVREADARATALHALFQRDEAAERNLALEQLAERDALTGMWNRRHLDRLLPAMLADHHVRGAPLSLAIADLDHFKRINDARSHLVGDATLTRLGALLERVVPEPGFSARLGGEEFVLVMPDVETVRAVQICESVCGLVRGQRWDLITDGLAVTVSIGVATAPPGSTMSDLLGRADEALYVAKGNGRDQVCG